VDRQGHVYVADSLARIQKFDANGRFMAAWGVRGNGDGEFRSGANMAINAQGIIFATDSANNRVQAFDAEGNYLTQWGGFGADIGQLNRPGAVGVDGHGAIYVAENANLRVQKFFPRTAWPATTKGTPTPRPPTPTSTPTNTPLPAGPPPFMTPAYQ
jgi:DNA-binding beta-propeller fold protein YncE